MPVTRHTRLIEALRDKAGPLDRDTARLMEEAADALERAATEVTPDHPWLVDRWTVGGDRPGEFALVHVFSPPNRDDNDRPFPLCERLTRAKDDAEFIREGWLSHERDVVKRYREGRS